MIRTAAAALLLATALAVVVAVPPAVAQDDDEEDEEMEIPYVGVWDCGVGVFTFTYESYNAGEGPLEVEDVELDGETYVLSLPDGYQVAVSGVTDETMQWLSLESGDSFDCARLYW